MKTVMNGRIPVTTIQPETKRKLLYVIEKLAPHTKTPALGGWKNLTDEEQWRKIVTQVCVMGSALPMEKLDRSGNSVAFEAALSLSTLSTKRAKEKYIAVQLAKFKATRFRLKAAARLASAFVNPNIVQDGRIVLLKDLPRGAPDTIREELLKRSTGLFKRKSVSDLMISVGLSHDVIALDQRVVGLLEDRLGYNRQFDRIQANRALYLSVEDCLRGVCREANISLGALDRMLFGFAGLSAIEYLVEFDLKPHSSPARAGTR